MPLPDTQRKACVWFPVEVLVPTTTLPSPETAFALLLTSPDRVPRLVGAPLLTQRNASGVLPLLAPSPTTTLPSAETAFASL